MGNFTWFSLTDSDVGHIADRAIKLVSAIMLYENVDFKTLSDRYTNSRMVPFLTYIDGDRANLFSINPWQKLTPAMVNQQLFVFFFFFFFQSKIGYNKHFSF